MPLQSESGNENTKMDLNKESAGVRTTKSNGDNGDVQKLMLENKTEIKRLNDKIDELLKMNKMSNYISMGIATVGVTAITALFAYHYIKSGRNVDLKKREIERMSLKLSNL